MGRSGRSTAVGLAALAATLPLSATCQEAAGDPAGGQAVSIIVTGAADAARPTPRNLVSIGFDTIAGAPRYADRVSGEGGAEGDEEGGGGVAVVRFSASRPLRTGARGAVPAALPIAGARLTSGYGYRVHPLSGQASSHGGIDLAAATGTPVLATADGVVGVAGWRGGYGMLVAIDHAGAVQTRYGHLSVLHVRPGDVVERGQVIGRSGSTGRSTGPHVHYEVRIGGYPVDPLAGT
jgi:murein DD-endopeptidase MepM/ murein hydrolase activator NlpD